MYSVPYKDNAAPCFSHGIGKAAHQFLLLVKRPIPISPEARDPAFYILRIGEFLGPAMGRKAVVQAVFFLGLDVFEYRFQNDRFIFDNTYSNDIDAVPCHAVERS